MTATTGRPSPTVTSQAPGSALTGTGVLLRFLLRRDRVRLPAWAAGFGLFVLYLAAALPVAYDTEQDLDSIALMFQGPVGRLMIGPGYGFDDPSFERFVANGYGLYFLLLAALMSILLVTRHTRVEEQTGRAELIRANVVGRHATLTATLAMAVITNLAVAVTVFVTMVSVGGYRTGGSALFAAGIAAIGLGFAGVTVLTAQLTEYSRAAAGMAGAVLGAAFVLRAGGDMAREGGNVLSWLSPLGWGQQTAPFVLDRWWPLALSLGLAAVTTALGIVLANRRDLAASLVAVKPGRPEATAALGNPLGLAMRLQRGNIIGWTVGLALGGLLFGAYADALLAAVDDLPEVFSELFGAADVLAGYLGYMAVFMSYLVSAYAVIAVQGLRAEETSGRADPVLATPVSRWAWLGSHLAVVAVAVVGLTAVTGVATGLGAAIVTGDTAHIGELTAAHLNHTPAALVVLGIAALLFAVLPRAISATWVVVGYGVIVGTFGPLMDLGQAAYNLSPFEHAAEMPLEPFASQPLLILTLVAAGAVVLALVAFRRRSVNVS